MIIQWQGMCLVNEPARTFSCACPAGGQFTGAALNPARVLGPAIVFHCYWDTAFIYVFGELFGGLLAAIIVLPLYGFGQFGSLLDTRLCNALGIKIPEKHQHR